MAREKHILLIKILLYIPLLLIAFILQAGIFALLPIAGAKPLILLAAVVGVAFFNGCKHGGGFGLAAGMLCDISYNQPTAEFTVMFTLIGICIGLLTDSLLAKGFPAFLICSICAFLICGILETLNPIIYEGAEVIPLMKVVANQLLYSLLFILPSYYTARFIYRTPRT